MELGAPRAARCAAPPRGGASPAAAGRRLPGNLAPAQEARARAASLGLPGDPDTHTGAAGGGTGGWARGPRPLTMVKTRFSRFLQKLGFSGAGHQYERLERGELETSVSLDARARSVGPDPPPSAPHAPIPSAWCAPPTRPPPPGSGEKRLRSNASSRFCSGPALLPRNPTLRMRN